MSPNLWILYLESKGTEDDHWSGVDSPWKFSIWQKSGGCTEEHSNFYWGKMDTLGKLLEWGFQTSHVHWRRRTDGDLWAQTCGGAWWVRGRTAERCSSCSGRWGPSACWNGCASPCLPSTLRKWRNRGVVSYGGEERKGKKEDEEENAFAMEVNKIISSFGILLLNK